MKKRGQLNLSFGMIFSIILIVVFLAFGTYAIIKIVDWQKTIQIQSFLRDLQNDVDKMWQSNQGSQVVTYSLPAKITAVCFSNDELRNLKFVSSGIIDGKMINNLDIAAITARENPYCIQNPKGIISFTIAKDFGETLVRIQR
jgi:hypothetical protein